MASPVPPQPCPSRSLEEEASPAYGYSYTHYMRFGQAASSLSRRASRRNIDEQEQTTAGGKGVQATRTTTASDYSSGRDR